MPPTLPVSNRIAPREVSDAVPGDYAAVVDGQFIGKCTDTAQESAIAVVQYAATNGYTLADCSISRRSDNEWVKCL
jgi:hypothetical protein